MLSQFTESQLYNQDFYAWTQSTAQLLKSQRWGEVDWANLIEEVESMGRAEKNALKSNLRVVLMHLLKYKYQTEKRSRSWLATITEHRQRIEDELSDSPSLKAYLEEVFEQTYAQARRQAVVETGLPKDAFPELPPFSLADAISEDFFL